MEFDDRGMGQAFNLSSPADIDFVAEFRRYAQNPDAAKTMWQLHRYDEVVHDPNWGDLHFPSLEVGIGHDVGVLLVRLGYDHALISTGGVNKTTVMYQSGEFSDWPFPPGAELPIQAVLEAVGQFIREGGCPTAIEWMDSELGPVPRGSESGNDDWPDADYGQN